MKELKVEHEEHPHDKECERFKDALDTGHIVIIDDELQIKGKFPSGGALVNIKNPEIRYDSDAYQYNVLIFYCPFCGKPFRRVVEKCKFCDGTRVIEGRNRIIEMGSPIMDKNKKFNEPCSKCNTWTLS